ncbi:MAG: hypothetical protein LBT64_00985 [Puniceicoccales bacterium]|jgi:hypothetical protein|nr:hypothetical protein [Puniceicoccales bacterium]
MPEFEEDTEGINVSVRESAAHSDVHIGGGEAHDDSEKRRVRYSLKRGKLPLMEKKVTGGNTENHGNAAQIVDVVHDAIGARVESSSVMRKNTVKKSTELVEDKHPRREHSRSDSQRGQLRGRQDAKPTSNANVATENQHSCACPSGNCKCAKKFLGGLIGKILKFFGIKPKNHGEQEKHHGHRRWHGRTRDASGERRNGKNDRFKRM